MIEFYPNNLDRNDIESPGEYELFARLKECASLRDWIVYHSQDVHDHVSQFMGEIDFIIIMPKKGVLSVEVKSCKTIDYDPSKETWKLGQEPEEKRGPFKQVRDNRISLFNYFTRKYPILKEVLFWDVVVFTKVNFNEKNIAWQRWEYIDRNQIAGSSNENFLRLFEKVLEEAYYANINKLPVTETSPDNNHIGLLKGLRKKIAIYMDPAHRREESETKLSKVFTENQRSTLEQLSRNPKCIIEGPAGTGKTLLAIEAARINAMQKKKTLFLCFNTLLGKHLSAIIKNINSETDKNYIHFFTITRLLLQITAERGLNDDSSEDKFQTLTIRALEKLYNNEYKFMDGNFDNLIIDEAQDILKDEYISILDLFIKDGLNKSSFFIFGDFYYQNVLNFEKDTSVDDFRKSYPSAVIPLKENCRNSPDVIDFAAKFCGFNPYIKYLREDVKTRPKIEKYKNNLGQLEKLDGILDKLLIEKYEPNEIVVLTMNTLSHSCLKFINFVSRNYDEFLIPTDGLDALDMARFEESQKKIFDMHFNKEKKYYYEELISQGFNDQMKFKHLHLIKNDNVTLERCILKTTIRKFKGLERNVVIITDVDNINNDKNKFLLHTGITRCLDKLFVLTHVNVKLDS